MSPNEQEEFEFRYRLEQEQSASPVKSPNFGQVVDYIKEKSGYNASPVGMLEKGFEKVDQLANKFGEKTTETLGKNQFNPYLSSAVGTTISIAPQAIAAFAGPTEASLNMKPRVLNPDFGESAIPLARRALGFTKRLLRTPTVRRQAESAAKVALKEGIIPTLGSTEGAMINAENLAETSGKAIGKQLKKASGNLSNMYADLEILRDKLTKGGLKKGLYEVTNSRIDKVQETIHELMDRGTEISGKQLTGIKNKLANQLNYFSDLESQVENKAIVRKIADRVRKFVEASSSKEDFLKFLENQKKFSAAETMKVGLNNELSSQAGNKPISLLTMIPAAAQLGVGNPIGAAATLGIGEALSRRGSGIGANALNRFNILGDSLANSYNLPLAVNNLGLGYTKKKLRK